jgi:transcriptional regulator with XRE-family HTH domain
MRVSFEFMSCPELMMHIAKAAQTRRLSINWSQQTLSDRSGVSFGVIKKFERVGKISVESLIKIALVLDAFEDFKKLFQLKSEEKLRSLDELFEPKKRKRGRK